MFLPVAICVQLQRRAQAAEELAAERARQIEELRQRADSAYSRVEEERLQHQSLAAKQAEQLDELRQRADEANALAEELSAQLAAERARKREELELLEQRTMAEMKKSADEEEDGGLLLAAAAVAAAERASHNRDLEERVESTKQLAAKLSRQLAEIEDSVDSISPEQADTDEEYLDEEEDDGSKIYI